MDQSDAVDSLNDAQRLSFEYMSRVNETIKYLFGLGVSNIAMNRSVVRELELKLKGASKEELDDLARQEIISVVKQLKAQEGMLKKIEDLEGNTKELHDNIVRHDRAISDLEKRNDNNKQEISNLGKTVNGKFPSIESRIEGNQRNISSLRADITKCQTDIDKKVKENADQCKKDISDVKKKLDSEIISVKNDAAKYQKSISADIDKKISDVKEKLDSEIVSVKNDAAEHQTDIDKKISDAKKSLGNKISSVKKDVTEIITAQKNKCEQDHSSASEEFSQKTRELEAEINKIQEENNNQINKTEDILKENEIFKKQLEEIKGLLLSMENERTESSDGSPGSNDADNKMKTEKYIYAAISVCALILSIVHFFI